jgi:hypothetical protein
MVTFELIVTPEFWDTPRAWPTDDGPIVFSTDLVMRHRGTLQVPLHIADAIEQYLRSHPQVLAIDLVPLPFPRATAQERRRAA